MPTEHEHFQRRLYTIYTPLLDHKTEVLTPVSERLQARFSPADRQHVLALAARPENAAAARHLAGPKAVAAARFLQVATHLAPDLARTRAGLTDAVPPADVHRMQRGAFWCGDFYSANMLVQALDGADLSLVPGRSYLDFGCSSGSLVRVMCAAYPECKWLGVDPVPASIAWAAANLPEATFATSPQAPPLAFADSALDGVSAISIWSHFSERAGLAWFDEMARIVKPGGFLFFTTHGIRTFRHQLDKGRLAVREIAALFDIMLEHQFAFQPIRSDYGLDLTDWGNAYFPVEWVVRRLSANWELKLNQPGRNQNNQDAYVLVRRG